MDRLKTRPVIDLYDDHNDGHLTGNENVLKIAIYLCILMLFGMVYMSHGAV